MKKISLILTAVVLMAGFLTFTAFETLPPGQSANGQGTLNLPYMNGRAQHFSFHANKDNNGNVTGSFESNSPGQSIRIHGNVTCLNILADGKTAIMVGVVTQVAGDNEFGMVVGSHIYFKVQDNGEGSNAAPDGFSDYLGPINPNITCLHNLNIGLNPIEGGNIQVRP